VTSPLRHVVDLLTYAGRRKGHDRADRLAVADLVVAPAELGLPTGLDVRWLGVAGYAITYEGTTVLIDPYVSRATMADSLRRRPALHQRLGHGDPDRDGHRVGRDHLRLARPRPQGRLGRQDQRARVLDRAAHDDRPTAGLLAALDPGQGPLAQDRRGDDGAAWPGHVSCPAPASSAASSVSWVTWASSDSSTGRVSSARTSCSAPSTAR